MRWISIAGATVLVSLLAAPTAVASTTTYSGSFAGSGTLSFKVSEKRGTWRLHSLRFTRFPLDCAGGDNTETAKLEPGYRPVQPHYPNLRVEAVVMRPHHRKRLSTLLFTGTVHEGDQTATGRMRIHGRKVPTDSPGNGSSDRCDSGKVPWSATSG